MPLPMVTSEVVLLGRRIAQSHEADMPFVDSMVPDAAQRVVKFWRSRAGWYAGLLQQAKVGGDRSDGYRIFDQSALATMHMASDGLKHTAREFYNSMVNLALGERPVKI